MGTGHRIQLKSGLLIPAYAYHIDCKDCFGKICTTTPHSFTFYSDSHGKSWRFWDFVPSLETVECQLVSVDEEDSTNALYCNSRSPPGYRVQALSKDDGAVFLEGQLEQPHGCHGSVVGFLAPILECGDTQTANPSNGQENQLYPLRSFNSLALSAVHGCRPSQNGTLHVPETNFLPPTWVIYSHPSSPEAHVQLGIYLSTFPRDSDSWSEPWLIYKGLSAYSDLAYVELPFTEVSPKPLSFVCCLLLGHFNR
ncbi:UNVERIFIED_CONTAM: hypothetical protein FKN15_008229 [Acipenser sinensis]